MQIVLAISKMALHFRRDSSIGFQPLYCLGNEISQFTGQQAGITGIKCAGRAR